MEQITARLKGHGGVMTIISTAHGDKRPWTGPDSKAAADRTKTERTCPSVQRLAFKNVYRRESWILWTG